MRNRTAFKPVKQSEYIVLHFNFYPHFMKNASIRFLFAIPLVAIGLASCFNVSFGIKGKGPVETETRSLKNFTTVQAGGSFDVEVEQGTETKVSLEGQRNILDVLKTEVQDNGTLKIYFDKNVGNYKKLKITVYAPDFEGLKISGSGNLKALNALTGKKLEVDISGSGDVKIPEANYETSTVSVSGSGNIIIAGAATEGNFHVSGSGDCNAGDLKCKKVVCSVAGSGNIECFATESLDARASGSGDVRYKGEPANKVVKTTGSGSVSSR